MNATQVLVHCIPLLLGIRMLLVANAPGRLAVSADVAPFQTTQGEPDRTRQQLVNYPPERRQHREQQDSLSDEDRHSFTMSGIPEKSAPCVRRCFRSLTNFVGETSQTGSCRLPVKV